MFKSIFNKLLITYLVIIIFIISILSLTLSYVYNLHVFNQKEKSLNSVALKIQNVVNQYNNNTISKGQLDAYLNSMGYMTDSSIYILKLNKQLLNNGQDIKLNNKLMEGYLIEDLKRVLNDNVVYKKNQYSNTLDTYVVFLGFPLRIDSQIKGAILIFSPISHIKEDITRINLIIWSISLLTMLISGIFIYANSLRISKPIKNIELAARKIASGENTKDLDITPNDEIGQLAVTFNYMKNKLIEIENTRREFLANISHDIKTPLTSINGFVEAMIDGVIEPNEYDETFKIIKEETWRLIKLTNDILKLSKIQSGVIKLKKKKFQVKSMLESIKNSTVISSENKKILIKVNCSDRLQIYGDEDKLKQIIINLVSNSIKYSNESVEIELIAVSKDKCIEFKVIDNGIGIESDKINSIFDKFYRVDKSRNTKTGGTGLGLNIVKKLVKLHGGEIYADSEIGEGTEIIFTIPM